MRYGLLIAVLWVVGCYPSVDDIKKRLADGQTP